MPLVALALCIGLSLSVLKVDDAILQRLDAPTKAPAWPVGVAGMLHMAWSTFVA